MQRINSIGDLSISNAEKSVRLNREIKAPQVRLIGAEGEQQGVVDIREAMSIAKDAGLDLVEVSPNADPPVCRVMDYGKFVFEQKKRKTQTKKVQVQVQVKELKYSVRIEEADYQVKFRNLLRFLEHGDKVKITLRFRGREMSHKELGMDLMQRLKKECEAVGSVEQEPKTEGRQIIMVLGPLKKK